MTTFWIVTACLVALDLSRGKRRRRRPMYHAPRLWPMTDEELRDRQPAKAVGYWIVPS